MASRSPRGADTPLARQLAGASPARPTALDAFQLARQTFLAGERVDMQALARALGVDRATLYRWAGSREQLLAEVLWSLIEPTIGRLRKTCGPVPGLAPQGQSPAAPQRQSPAAPQGQPPAAPQGQPPAAPQGQSPAVPRGQSAAAAVIIGTVRGVMSNSAMQRFIDREGDLALRLLTTKASGFETRLIALIGELVREEAWAGRLAAAVPLDDLPYVLVRVMESYIYLGLITGEHPDPDRAARVISALLPAGK